MFERNLEKIALRSVKKSIENERIPDISSKDSVFKKTILYEVTSLLGETVFFENYFKKYRLNKVEKLGDQRGIFEMADRFVEHAFMAILNVNQELRDLVEGVNKKDKQILESLDKNFLEIKNRIILFVEAQLTKDDQQFKMAIPEISTLPIEDVRKLVDSMDDIKE